MKTPKEFADCDVLVIGTGAGGLLTANRAHDLGLRTLVIEKSERYGGTSSLSGGGLWIPCNKPLGDRDSAGAALTYLKACTRGLVPEDKLRVYIDQAPQMIEYLREQVGVRYYAVEGYPDYYQDLPGAAPGGRTMFAEPVDAGVMGDEYLRQRESGLGVRLFGRIALDFPDAMILGKREKGWVRHALKLVSDYWLDFAWRRRTRRDRRATMGAALIAGLRLGLFQRQVPVVLNTALRRLIVEDGRVAGAVVERDGNEFSIRARRGVVLACGGFEHNQVLRERHLVKPTSHEWSVTPTNYNTGAALTAGLDVGADTEFLDQAWWIPTVRLPALETPNVNVRHGLFIERAYPHSICVNRLGQRFTNEAMSYNDFGHEMLKDQDRTGANVPCWMIFDASYRRKSVLGNIMPSTMQPDSALPSAWWDAVIYRAATLEELARKIDIEPAALAATVTRFNGFARSGKDLDFQRGVSSFDRYYCDPRHQPNSSLGALESAPFYAIRLDLGDLGTKGGLKFDTQARVLDTRGEAIPGLYVIGNASGAVTAHSYPGAGGTLGPAMTFGYVAASHIAAQAQAGAPGLSRPAVAEVA
jgi:3-oxosteroid 1-dehydrogenase